MTPPFKATSCACDEDRANCTRQPGHFLPGQLEKVAEWCGVPVDTVRVLVWNSPGMVVADSSTGERARIRTITPKMDHGQCVFLHEDRCDIHPVAPFGCRYFDVHMNLKEARRRSTWGMRYILDRMDEYSSERDGLDEATSYNPGVPYEG